MAAHSAQPFFASRAEAVAALLKRTTYSAGAKFFSSGGITLHVTDLVLPAATAPEGLKVEVRLLGQTVHKFDVDPKAKGDERAQPGDMVTYNLGQVVCYELPPNDLAEKLAKTPRLELCIFDGGSGGRNGQQRVVINGVSQSSAMDSTEPVAMATFDLAGMAEDLVGARLPLERVAAFHHAPSGAESYDEVDASVPYGEIVTSIVAERRDGGKRRAEGGGGPGSLSGYGTGDPRSLYKAPSAPGSEPGSPGHSVVGPAAAAAVTAGYGSRPPSRGGGSVSFGAGGLGGSLGGPGSVVSLGGGDAASSERLYFETPVGFQYKAIPRRYLTPTRSRSPFGDEDGARSEAGASAIGGGGASSALGRSQISYGGSTASGSVFSNAGNINSHAIAEGFWTAWREKQLPRGVPAPGDVAVVIEVRYDTKAMSVQHDGPKYERYAQRVRELVETVLGSTATVVTVPEDRASASRAIASWQTAHGARLGAFEVQMCYRQPGVGLVSELLHSKLISNKWPHKDLGKIEHALRSFTRKIRLRPFVYTQSGTALPVAPFISMSDGTSVGTVKVRMGKDEVPCNAVDVAPMPSGAVNLAGVPIDPVEKDVGDAKRQMAQFMRKREVVFHGAGEPGVASNLDLATKAFNLMRVDKARAPQNEETLEGVARIIKAFPKLHWVVHGETGKASTAPQALSEHLLREGILDDRAAFDVDACMRELALLRAKSCYASLTGLGVNEVQLHTSSKGMGGNVGVRFIPMAQPPAGKASASKSGADREERRDATSRGAANTPQALEFKMVRGNEFECFAGVDPADEREKMVCEFEPFLTPLSSLMLGTAEGGSGKIDVPIELHLRPVRFELTIECQSSSPGEPRRLASDAQFQVAPKGQRSKAFNFHVEPMQQASMGKCTIAWEGHVEYLELTPQGSSPQVVNTWAGSVLGSPGSALGYPRALGFKYGKDGTIKFETFILRVQRSAASSRETQSGRSPSSTSYREQSYDSYDTRGRAPVGRGDML